ncbi:hypothetical protein L9F63_025939 [Diploptera punctata]|uniref:Uncharacterized protein n=1 Tax=Diploptera punctata TaxID=6984 RepID=A0AAD7Z584_DIPPU|nr:hypothetical protein L9F63_025939 [Diploptera punctata]
MGTYWMLAILVIWSISAVSPMCRDSADCAPDGCCTVANMPYPTPTCNRYRAEGDTCNPSNKAFNASSSAPDGSPWYKAPMCLATYVRVLQGSPAPLANAPGSEDVLV